MGRVVEVIRNEPVGARNWGWMLLLTIFFAPVFWAFVFHPALGVVALVAFVFLAARFERMIQRRVHERTANRVPVEQVTDLMKQTERWKRNHG